MGLRDLCQIHEPIAYDVARLTTEMYLSDMEPAMKPSDAFAKMAHREIERVPIDELEGRVTSILLTPYPPGIPLLIPGERFNKTIVDYLKFARDFNEKFPGFETDVHGLVKREVNGRRVTSWIASSNKLSAERVNSRCLRRHRLFSFGIDIPTLLTE
jgi:arginine decarboxylase